MSLMICSFIKDNPLFHEKCVLLASRELSYLSPHGIILRLSGADSIDPDTLKKYMKKR